MSRAIVLIAHGSRREKANQDLVRLTSMVRQRRPETIVEMAYLELVQPDIPSGVQRCLQQGAKSVCLLPYFLSPGAHVTQDLEAFRRKFAEEHPDVTFSVAPPLGVHPKMVDVLLERWEST